jgi:hypothetical protein
MHVTVMLILFAEKGAAEFTAMAIRARLYQFNLRAMAGGCGQTPVARQQGYVEHLGERDIGGIIGRQIVPQIPNARQKEIVRIPPQRKVRQIGEGHAAARAIDFAICGIPSNYLCDFDIKQMRRVECLMRRE